ncbi:MAG: PLP-dependent aminotransferase family protein [Betaproteobacteria bacterium]|nr:PLP-dependent aminotransferase family protein [Betaproteobacteria bacterium]MCC6248166.1 PLP-dependent aminotransferase family protein [Rubrivivax sp.]
MSTTQAALPRAAPREDRLARAGRATLSEQLAERFAERIRQRLLSPGTRLPSVRECAARHGVSASTVVGAYDLLQAQGLVHARPQRGFFVREAAAPGRVAAGGAGAPGAAAVDVSASAMGHATHPAAGVTSPGASAATETPPRPVDATALIRGMFRLRRGAPPSPGQGTLPEAWLDAPLLQRALRRVTAGAGAAGWLSYGDPAGDLRLRQALVRRLADIGVPAEAGQIVTTVGATHALDLVARTLLVPGDAVLVDEPGWAVEYARLSRMGLRLLPVPRGPEGPDLAVMQALAEAHRPRLYVTVSVLHNPTGASLAPAHAHRLLRLAEALDFWLVEDDTYAWLAPPHATRVAQLDALQQRTVYVSGFSKILVPQWRVGYVAAPPALAERLIDTKMLGTLTTPAPLEQAIAWCLEQGALRRHAERVAALLAAARARTVRLAREAGCRFVTPPEGLFGWIDVGADTEPLAHLLLDEGWLTAPGTLFHATPRPTTLMRINFGTAQDARFWQRLQIHRAEDRKRGG